ncbi:hypothetical protein LE190_02205 [Massilia oculi]|uniref:Uncharacterized protein n=1 Tax=Massilia hydrophila TaxID=3044279 RepID=A0ABS7Y6M9_9BURK|nr:hypothetical protein [Massilia oculi]MCA1854742.1 hypothetical protein [Massilia oculi]
MTSSILLRALCLAAFAAACAAPVHATSSASSASSAGSASSGSVSDSIGASSNSSGGERKVAAGDYRVIDLAQAPAKADTTRLTLRAVAADAAGAAREFTLDVPNRALAERGLGKGELVRVNERAYGFEFAHADTRRAFFLALQDDWYRDLASRKVTI